MPAFDFRDQIIKNTMFNTSKITVSLFCIALLFLPSCLFWDVTSGVSGIVRRSESKSIKKKAVNVRHYPGLPGRAFKNLGKVEGISCSYFDYYASGLEAVKAEAYDAGGNGVINVSCWEETFTYKCNMATVCEAIAIKVY